MTVALCLLDDVRWRGKVVVGERPRALLAALAANDCRPVRSDELIAQVWGEDAPVNAAKSLQVLVSRTRSACGGDLIMRDGAGYRLGVKPHEVDSVALAACVREARALLDHDAGGAAEMARTALALAGGLPAGGRAANNGADGCDHHGPLRELRRSAVADAERAAAVLGHALSRTGAHAEALPLLEEAHHRQPQDESLLADLLRSEAAVRGPSAALERFERHRRDLRERLGTSPGELLGRVQRDLLALDQPVRSGLRFDTTALLGRERDLQQLRALMSAARVVSIVGAGGLGKTRLAHVLARDAAAPAVHVVELVGVASPDDLLGELGSALDIRDSVAGRKALTREQRADVRARIAQRLGQAPSLLVLDNCEHLVAAVAELVAFLVSTTADLRVLTTSRAPLAIAAERVYLLGELGTLDATTLFRERAVAARPGVTLDDATVERIVTRLDGLPLAIELAAAKVRVMTVEEIDRRLENRFALLRGGDRSAPDRHQTLLAVIDWSWNLLDAAERRGLSRMALWGDGFTLDAAEVVLGDGALALEIIDGLVTQSLLSVRETADGLRYRMLETVREFGRMQLIDTGEDRAAYAARRAWATGFAVRHGMGLSDADQLSSIDAIAAEEINLADETRATLADGDPEGLVQLLVALGMFWAIRGEHARLFAMTDAVSRTVDGWDPPPELADATRTAMAIMLSNASVIGERTAAPMRALLRRLGPADRSSQVSGMVRVMLALDPDDPQASFAALHALADSPERHTALMANQWLGHALENSGDLHGALAAAERALTLVRPEDGPWPHAFLHHLLAQLTMHEGDRQAAIAHAQEALPTMERLGAHDDVIQLRSLAVLCAISEHRLDDAAAELARIDELAETASVFGGLAVRRVGYAELALARGDTAQGLHAYWECMEAMRVLEFPGIPLTGLEPWTLFGEATALAAHAHHATTAEQTAMARALFAETRSHALQYVRTAGPQIDFPVIGLLLFSLGAWALLRCADQSESGVRCIALAGRFSYNRSIPSMMWERIVAAAERAAQGRLAEIADEYRGRPPELLDDARLAIEALDAGG